MRFWINFLKRKNLKTKQNSDFRLSSHGRKLTVVIIQLFSFTLISCAILLLLQNLYSTQFKQARVRGTHGFKQYGREKDVWVILHEFQCRNFESGLCTLKLEKTK